MTVRIRREVPSDVAAIEAVTAAAFLAAPHTSHTEQFIVNALRRAGQLSISLVAEDDGKLIGHVAISPVAVSDGSGGWYGLGPISVVPPRQGQGIGSQLMERALAELRSLGASGCVLVGDPRFYSRFGFRPERSLAVPDVPPEYLLALLFRGPMSVGTVTFHEAFNA
jgi:putative acetyltransferase